MRSLALRLLLIFAALFSSGSALGQSNIAEAKRLFRAGARAYDAGEFAAAVQAFDQAYELSPRIALRFSAAQALRRQYTVVRDPELLRKAQGYYRDYVEADEKGKRIKDAVEALEEVELLLQRLEPPVPAPPGEGGGESEGEGGSAPAPEPAPPPARAPTKGTLQVDSNVEGAVAEVSGPRGTREVDELPQWLEVAPGSYRVTIRAEGYEQGQRTVRVEAGRLSLADPPLTEKPGRLTIRSEEGAEVLVDGRSMGRAPIAFDLDRGAHRVVVGIDGHEVFSEDVVVERDRAQTIDAELGMTSTRITAWSFIGAGAASALTGIGFGIAAGREQGLARELDDLTNPDAGPPRALTIAERDTYNGHISTRDNLARVAGSLIGIGAISSTVGLLLYVLDPPDLYGAATVLDPQGSPEDSSDDEDTDAPTMDLDASFTPDPRGRFGGSLILRGRF